MYPERCTHDLNCKVNMATQFFFIMQKKTFTMDKKKSHFIKQIDRERESKKKKKLYTKEQNILSIKNSRIFSTPTT